MFPLADQYPTRRRPYITWLLILINVIIFLLQLGLTEEARFALFRANAVVPVLVTREPFALETALDFFRSLFFHGDWLHLLGNMAFLFVFGDNIEDWLGKRFYLVFYFGCGLVASLAEIALSPTSPIPMIGASGAIAGIMGAYIVLFGHSRISIGILFLGFVPGLLEVPAYVMLGVWFGLQLLNASLLFNAGLYAGGGVAFLAHIGGFVMGVIVGWLVDLLMPTHRLEGDDDYHKAYADMLKRRNERK
jgi:membrane associated rhomboid family serine protease